MTSLERLLRPLAELAAHDPRGWANSLSDPGCEDLYQPYVPLTLDEIPQPDFLYGDHYIRGCTTATVGDTTVGKTFLLAAEAVALATGFPILGVVPARRERVLYLDGEDDPNMLRSRIAAICQLFEIPISELEDWLVIRPSRKGRLKFAKGGGGGTEIGINHAAVAELRAVIRRRNIGAVIVDPLVSFHSIPEAANEAMDQLVKDVFNEVADREKCAVHLVHHPRKHGDRELTIEDMRGGGAFGAAVRSARLLRPMNLDEAERFGVEAAHREQFVHAKVGKANFSRKGGVSWYRFKSVPVPGDARSRSVGVLTAWSPPDVRADLSHTDRRSVQEAVAASGENGEGWRKSPQAGERCVLHAVAAALDLDLVKGPDKLRASHVLKTMLADVVDRHGILTP